MNRAHTFEEKLNLVTQVKNGQSIGQLCRIHHLDRRMLREWVSKYDLYGEQGLHKQPIKRYTGTFREEVVRSIIEKSISLPQAVLQYSVSRSILKNWLKIARTDGYAALNHQCLGGPVKTMGRKKKSEPLTELEKLQAENVRLRAENALLKKVRALVQQREPRARMSGQKPSKN